MNNDLNVVINLGRYESATSLSLKASEIKCFRCGLTHHDDNHMSWSQDFENPIRIYCARCYEEVMQAKKSWQERKADRINFTSYIAKAIAARMEVDIVAETDKNVVKG